MEKGVDRATMNGRPVAAQGDTVRRNIHLAFIQEDKMSFAFFEPGQGCAGDEPGVMRCMTRKGEEVIVDSCHDVHRDGDCREG